MDESGTLSSLRSPKFVREAIIQALQEGDYDQVVEIYRGHLRILNRSHTAKALNVSRQYVHKMLEPTNNPSLRVFVAFMRVLKERVALEIAAVSTRVM
jgi:DNA-binding phage protein